MTLNIKLIYSIHIFYTWLIIKSKHITVTKQLDNASLYGLGIKVLFKTASQINHNIKFSELSNILLYLYYQIPLTNYCLNHVRDQLQIYSYPPEHFPSLPANLFRRWQALSLGIRSMYTGCSHAPISGMSESEFNWILIALPAKTSQHMLKMFVDE